MGAMFKFFMLLVGLHLFECTVECYKNRLDIAEESIFKTKTEKGPIDSLYYFNTVIEIKSLKYGE